jgi:transposase-like protein
MALVTNRIVRSDEPRSPDDGSLQQRERQRRRFRSPGSAQRFLSTHAAVYTHFDFQRHLISRRTHRELRSQAFAIWREIAAA